MRWPWSRRSKDVEEAKARLDAARVAKQQSEQQIERAQTILDKLDEHRRSNGFAELIEEAMTRGRAR